MSTVRNVTSGTRRRKLQAAWFLLNRVHISKQSENKSEMKGYQNTSIHVFCKWITNTVIPSQTAFYYKLIFLWIKCSKNYSLAFQDLEEFFSKAPYLLRWRILQ